MNETMPAKKKRKILLPALIAVLVVLAAGFILSQAGLDKALVKQRLDESIATIKERGRAHGRDINITYGDIEVAGTLLSNRVIVSKPVFTIKPLNREPLTPGQAAKPDSLVVTTDEMVIYRRSVDLSAIQFSFEKPLYFASENEPEKRLLTLEADSPIAVTSTRKTINGVPYAALDHTSPANLTLTYLREQKAEGKEEETPTVTPVYQTLLVAVAPGSRIVSETATDGSGLGRMEMNYGKITLMPKDQPAGTVEIAAISSRWNHVVNEQKKNVATVKTDIGPITAAAELLPYAPIAMNVDMVFEGNGPKPPAAQAEAASAPAAPEPQESTLTINKFALTTKDAALNATANFTASPTDIMPVGAAQLGLTNVPFVLEELRKVGLLNAQTESRYLPLVELVAGEPVATMKDLNIAIKRERGGAFQIGKTTFEELFATILKQAMQSRSGNAVIIPAPAGKAGPAEAPAAAPQSKLVPQLPPADKPRLSPIAVPDNGVRG